MIIYILRTCPARHEARSRNDRVGVATGYELEGRCSNPSKEKKCFCSPQNPDRHHVHVTGGGGLFRLQNHWCVKVTTDLQLLPTAIMVELYLQTLIRLNCLAFNQLSAGTTLPLYSIVSIYLPCNKFILSIMSLGIQRCENDLH
jgi:hypothetical protein